METSTRPSGDHARLFTSLPWPRSVASTSPVSASHTRTAWSAPAVAARLPQGDSRTRFTLAEGLAWRW